MRRLISSSRSIFLFDSLLNVPNQRLCLSACPTRRELALNLLVDISGSTDAWVTGNLQIIDVEKDALLIVYHALGAMGDPHAIQAFSGEGPERVGVWPMREIMPG